MTGKICFFLFFFPCKQVTSNFLLGCIQKRIDLRAQRDFKKGLNARRAPRLRVRFLLAERSHVTETYFPYSSSRFRVVNPGSDTCEIRFRHDFFFPARCFPKTTFFFFFFFFWRKKVKAFQSSCETSRVIGRHCSFNGARTAAAWAKRLGWVPSATPFSISFVFFRLWKWIFNIFHPTWYRHINRLSLLQKLSQYSRFNFRILDCEGMDV